MKLKSFFFILAFLLMVVWTVLLFIATQENGWRFYLIEGIITFSLIYLVYFYRKVIKPLNSIAGGMDLLQAQDFSSRLAPVGQKEADHIVSIFNRMMQQLKDERTRLREQNHFLDLLISVSPMGVIILTLDEQISMANKAALEFLEEESEENLLDKTMDELKGSLADELKRIPKDTTVTIRLSDSRIYRCSRLSFIDRGFAHPFFLIESLTAEVMKAEKKAYEKVIRMIAHEVNNSVAGVVSALGSLDDVLSSTTAESIADDIQDVRTLIKVCEERSFKMSRFIGDFANVVKIPSPRLRPIPLNDCVIHSIYFMRNMCLF